MWPCPTIPATCIGWPQQQEAVSRATCIWAADSNPSNLFLEVYSHPKKNQTLGHIQNTTAQTWRAAYLGDMRKVSIAVPEEDVSGLAAWSWVDELFFEGVQGAVVNVDRAAGSNCIRAARLGRLSAERDVTVLLLGLHELHAIFFFCSWS